jgi:PAS domain S-box-containing protein
MKVRKPISSRLAVVMMVSLAFQLALMCLLYTTLMEGIRERKAEAKTSSITWQINTCVVDALTMAISFAFLQMTDSSIYKTRLDEALKQAGESIEKMTALVSGEDPSLVNEANAFVTLIGRQRELIENTTGPALPGSVKLESPGNFATGSSIGEKLKVLRFIAIYRKLTLASTAARERLLTIQSAVQESRAKTYSDLRKRNILVLKLAIAASFLICITMGLVLYRSIELRLRNVRANAEQFGADLKVLPMAAEGDEIDEVNRLFLDMTRVLKETKQQEEAILENASSVICTIDPDGRIMSANAAAKKLWGLHPDDLLGLRLNRHMTEKEAQMLQGHLQRIAKDGRGKFETRMELPNSGGRDIEWNVSALDKDNCFVCIAHDITEKKNLENLKREFAEIIQSDLRDSLDLIRLVLSEVSEQPETPAVMMEKASNTIAVVDRLSSLVGHMTELRGARSSRFASVRSSLLIDRAVSSLAEWAQARGVTIEAEAHDEKLYADEERIVRVLINLISNAVKFSESGSIVRVSAQVEDQFIHFKVIDQGPGIDEAYREIIFQRFEQIEDETGKSKQGAGLGLAICKSIIDEHDGDLGVSAAEPTGSCFWFRLKRHLDA